MSVALYKLMQSTLRIEPEMCMGHSVGEYSALTAVSALSFEDAVYAVRKRGEAMQAALTSEGSAILHFNAESFLPSAPAILHMASASF